MTNNCIVVFCNSGWIGSTGIRVSYRYDGVKIVTIFDSENEVMGDGK